MKSVNDLKPQKLEDCNPGATKADVMSALKKVAKTSKLSQKHDEPPVASS